MRQAYTESEIQYVKANFPKMTKREIARNIGRTYDSVKHILRKKEVKTQKTGRKSTLCWKCAKATDYRKCPWSIGKPVPGWQAERGDIIGALGLCESYCVKQCPNFERDRRC